MIYRLDLNSSVYFSSTTKPRTASRITYAVDWSFLPENQPFKMTFSLVSKKRYSTSSFSGVITNFVEANFGSPFTQNVSGGNLIRRNNNYVLGFWHIKKPTTAATDNYINISPEDNPPVYLPSRPSSNFITITQLTNTKALSGFTNTDYLMTLFFEEC
jgi:hypothetical protein